jgi:hypothetical protein
MSRTLTQNGRALKNCSKKHPQARAAWKERQRITNAAKGKQTFNPETKQWERGENNG